MKTTQLFIALTITVMLGALGGCNSDTGNQTGEQAADVLECVIPGDICTRDINECGNPSSCTCPDGYEYNAAIGECLFMLGAEAGSDAAADEQPLTASGNESIEHCVVEPEGICTRDINECGNPSSCSCPSGYEYNAAAGQCLLQIR